MASFTTSRRIARSRSRSADSQQGPPHPQLFPTGIAGASGGEKRLHRLRDERALLTGADLERTAHAHESRRAHGVAMRLHQLAAHEHVDHPVLVLGRGRMILRDRERHFGHTARHDLTRTFQFGRGILDVASTR